jgi:ABC-2 type transport system ATP-binding protein
MTTHHMDEAEELCHRVGVLHFGCLAAIGTPAELRAQVGPLATLDDVFIALTGRKIGHN